MSRMEMVWYSDVSSRRIVVRIRSKSHLEQLNKLGQSLVVGLGIPHVLERLYGLLVALCL
jgi:hypothetical protein